MQLDEYMLMQSYRQMRTSKL